MTFKIQLDHAGLAQVLRSAEMQALVREKANAVAGNVKAMNIGVGDRDGGPREKAMPVRVTSEISDRARCTVWLAHPAGEAVQAKHGALTKAAAAAGLEVKKPK